MNKLAPFAASILWALGSVFLGCGGGGNDTSSSSTGGSSTSPSSSSGATSTGGTGGTGGATSSSSAGGGTSSSSGTGGMPPMPNYDCSAPSGAAGNLMLTTVASSLNAPVLVKAAPDDPDRLYIVQQSGE